jgi:hypothetical protein
MTVVADGSSLNPVRWVLRWAEGLRFPTLFLLTATLFVVDLIVPDLIPLADEILLGLGTLLLGNLRRRGRADGDARDPVERARDVTPPRR